MNSKEQLVTYGLPKPPKGLEMFPDLPEALSRGNKNQKAILLKSSKEFNQGQIKVFHTLLNGILLV